MFTSNTSKTSRNLLAGPWLPRLRVASLLLSLAMAQTAMAWPGVVTPVYFPATPTANPGNLNMYEYVPSGAMPARAPMVVVLPGCGQTAANYAVQSGWTRIASARRFYLVIAEQKAGLVGNNAQGCFNWFQPNDTARLGGEAESIAQMVTKFRSNHSVDAGRVFVTGLSAGGAMTAVMLATYPDVFQGGAIHAGVPYGCATNAAQGNSCLGTPGSAALPVRSALDWGNLARAGFPGWVGHRPSVMIFHGSADTTVAPARMNDLKDQWTNYGALDGTIATNTRLKGYPRATYGTPVGVGTRATAVQTVSITGMGHGVAIDPAFPGLGAPDQCGVPGAYVLSAGLCTSYYTAGFWGL